MGGLEAEKYLHNHYRKINLENVSAVAMGDNRGYALKTDGTVWSWSNSIIEGTTNAKQLNGLQGIVNISAAVDRYGDFIDAIDKKGDLWVWRNVSPVGLYITDRVFKNAPEKKKRALRSVVASENNIFLLTDTNDLLIYSTLFKKGVTYVEPQGTNIYWISQGKIWILGRDNSIGQLGNGLKTNYSVPQTVINELGVELKIQ